MRGNKQQQPQSTLRSWLPSFSFRAEKLKRPVPPPETFKVVYGGELDELENEINSNNDEENINWDDLKEFMDDWINNYLLNSISNTKLTDFWSNITKVNGASSLKVICRNLIWFFKQLHFNKCHLFYVHFIFFTTDVHYMHTESFVTTCCK